MRPCLDRTEALLHASSGSLVLTELRAQDVEIIEAKRVAIVAACSRFSLR